MDLEGVDCGAFTNLYTGMGACSAFSSSRLFVALLIHIQHFLDSILCVSVPFVHIYIRYHSFSLRVTAPS